MAVAVEAVPKLVTLTVMVRVVTVLMFMEVAQKLAVVAVVVTTIALRLVVLVAAGQVGHATTQTRPLVLQTLVVEAVAEDGVDLVILHSQGVLDLCLFVTQFKEDCLWHTLHN
tara:strand:+ start:192 stop:530 length:339 start_codon:yes stop_codon:yes gene_type:complete